MPLLPTTRKESRRDRMARPARMPAQPTDAIPGSPEKVAVLAARAASRMCLWHPADRRDSLGLSFKMGMSAGNFARVILGVQCDNERAEEEDRVSGLASRLRRLRKQHGKKLLTVAYLSGLDVGAVHMLESGKRADPRLSTLLALCRVYGCSLNDLVGPDATPPGAAQLAPRRWRGGKKRVIGRDG